MSRDNAPRVAPLPSAAKRDVEAVQNSALGFDVEAQLSRFQHRLQAETAASEREPVRRKRWVARRTLLLVACLSLTAAAVAVTQFWLLSPPAPASSSIGTAAVVSKPARLAPPSDATNALQEPSDAAAPPTSSAVTGALAPEALPLPSPTRIRSAPSSSASAAQLKEETEQLAQLRSIYEREPARALQLCDQADRHFAGGVFGVEREAIRIVALNAVGQRQQAVTRAKQYLARYPRGPLSQNIRSIAQLD